MSPEAIEILACLGVALAAGFVVGAEREQGGNTSFGGVRTFPLIALAGGVGMLLGWAGLAVMGLLFGALLTISYVRDSAKSENLGISTEIAAVVTFGLGALCTARLTGLDMHDRMLLVAAGATATLALLSIKRPLHSVIAKLSEEEVFAIAKLLALAVIVLPLLPDQAVGPWGAINPRGVGLLAVLISAIGFAGYAAIRIFGAQRGLGLTGLLGGLVSSTAVTLAFSGRARAKPGMTRACAVAIVLASATMFPRVAVEVAAVSPELARRALAPLLAAGAAVFLVGALFYWRLTRSDGPRDGETELDLGNPFRIGSAIKWAAVFVVVLLVSHGASHYFSDAGIYLSAGVSGLADVDAISLSVARLYEQQSIGHTTALVSILVATASNTLTKIGLALVIGSGALAVRVSAGLFAGLTAGAAALLIGTAL